MEIVSDRFGEFFKISDCKVDFLADEFISKGVLHKKGIPFNIFVYQKAREEMDARAELSRIQHNRHVMGINRLMCAIHRVGNVISSRRATRRVCPMPGRLN